MFKFNFDIEDEDDVEAADPLVDGRSASPHEKLEVHAKNAVQPEKLWMECPLNELLSALPPAISYSPIPIPLSSRSPVTLARRDLFDARFQLMSLDEPAFVGEGNSGIMEGLEFLEAPSDLVPGVYEGGLKTWECSLDLVECLDEFYSGSRISDLRGKRLLELGCGTAVPTLYLLHRLFSGDASAADRDVHIHLQDYNALVLRLVTLPNVLLAWYMSPASAAHRASASAPAADADAPCDPLPAANPAEPGVLPITPALIAAFRASLHAHRVRLRFFSSPWETFDLLSAGGPYDVLITSETIYRTESLPVLVDLLWRACVGSGDGRGGPTETRPHRAHGPAALTSSQLVTPPDPDPAAGEPGAPQYLCLVAAKLVYFGVGGGVADFVHAVEDPGPAGGRKGGVVRTVLQRGSGVKRSVMRVVWPDV
ncbi:hypothetical protein AcV7_001709 [Taiwanofungus camphoratus]|nr:hypothetical protein AcV7_001709 [Antrodia cinnamomea]